MMSVKRTDLKRPMTWHERIAMICSYLLLLITASFATEEFGSSPNLKLGEKQSNVETASTALFDGKGDDIVLMRGGRKLLSRSLNRNKCDLNEVYAMGKCAKMHEYGERCDSNRECYSGNCIEESCDCPNPSSCWGCASSGAPCVRIEQTNPSQTLQICSMAANVRDGEEDDNDVPSGSTFRMFSVGGKGITDIPTISNLKLSASSKASKERNDERLGQQQLTTTDEMIVSPAQRLLQQRRKRNRNNRNGGRTRGNNNGNGGNNDNNNNNGRKRKNGRINRKKKTVPNNQTPRNNSRTKSNKAKTKEDKLTSRSKTSKARDEFTSNSKSSKACPNFHPFIESHGTNMPPAFAQANILARHSDDISELIVTGSFDGLKDSVVFLDDNWITTINEEHRSCSKSSKGSLSTSCRSKSDKASYEEDKAVMIPVWPRKKKRSAGSATTSSGTTTIIEVESEAKLDFHVREGHGVEFVGKTAEDSTVFVLGTIRMDGQLSFKNLRVSFDGGSIIASGPLIFQHSNLVGLSRCPPSFVEYDGLCLHATEMIDQADDALETCSLMEGYLPSKDELTDVADVAKMLLRGGESMWIAPEQTGSCTSISQDGTITSYPTSSLPCEEFTRVLCADVVNDAIVGMKYTSYFSNQLFSNHRELFDRLVDPDRLPIQLGGTLSVYQEDGFTQNNDGELVPVTYTVTDAVPSSISVVVNLVTGKQRDVQVALDTLDEPSYESPHRWNFHAGSTLPSKVHVHVNGPVCLSSVDVLFRNETGSDHLVLSIPATLFEGCLDYNVCGKMNEHLCGRSLMYLDQNQGCAIMQADSASYPRDLALDLLEGQCSRLVSYSHPQLGQPFMVQIDGGFHFMEDLELKELSSSRNQYTFKADSGASIAQYLDESNRLPTSFSLSGGYGAQVKSVSITRYGKIIAGVDLTTLWDCINVCPALAHKSNGLLFGKDMVSLALLDLLNVVECLKLASIYTNGGSMDGREACASPPKDITSVEDLKYHTQALTSPDSQYRTLSAKITANIEDKGTLVIPTNRGVSVFVDSAEKVSFNVTNFHVLPFAECYINNVILNGSASITVEEDGVLEVNGCDVSITSSQPAFLVNKGLAVLTSVKVLENSELQNHGGRLELLYVDFRDSSAIENVVGSLSLSRLQFYEAFNIPKGTGPPSIRQLAALEPFGKESSRSLLSDPQVILEEATRRYYTVDDESDPLCFGSDIPDVTLQLGSTECIDVCEDSFVCSGVLVYFDEDNEAQCDLCLREEACAFDCSAVNSVYYKAESNFDYTKVSACTALSRPFELLDDFTLEECKLFCSWYKTCEGFSLHINPADSTTSCDLIADLDFKDSCSDVDGEIIYIPYLPVDPEEYLTVEGALLNQSSSLAVYQDKNISECSALCDKTLSCSSFYADDSAGDCELHGSIVFSRALTHASKLHISIDEVFPKKRYMAYVLCPIEIAYASYNTKIHQRCEAICSSDLTCVAFTFEEYQSHDILNCKLHDRVAVIDELFEERNCIEATEISVAYATESFVPHTLQQEFMFREIDSVSNLLEDECKSLCLFDADCVAIQYLPFNAATNETLCLIGSITAAQEVEESAVDNVLILEARSSDLGSQYFATPACYEGEALDVVSPITVHRAFGYVRLEKACTTSLNNGNLGGIMAPADCGLQCDKTDGCGGFLYYRNYTGQLNLDIIGQCQLIEGEVRLGTCDAVEHNSDVYLRSDVGSVCEAACNVHHLCSSFVPRIIDASRGEVECELYSDIALLDECQYENRTSVHIGLSYRERDVLVEAKDQCFIDFEDTALVGCYGPFPTASFKSNLFARDTVTPYHCQQHCRAASVPYYAVSEGTQCYCSSSSSFYEELLSSSNCTTPCNGDSSQMCGGEGFALIGSTDLPLQNLTLSQCKRQCFEDSKCEAILYTESKRECELRSSALFETCDESSNASQAYVESFEHYYEAPSYSYIGDSILHAISIDLHVDCQKICDAFLRCEAIDFDENTSINNCKLLGGDIVRLGPNETTEGISVARDVTLFTDGFMPDSRELTRLAAFDLDECKALCEAHAFCGSMLFANRSCILYPRSGFSNVEGVDLPATPHFVDFKAFVDIEQEFIKAEGFCIDSDSGTIPLDSRVTTQSPHDCAARCNLNLYCRVFTYKEESKSDCILYGEDVSLKDSCGGVSTSTFLMFTRGRFTEKKEACLKNEANEPFALQLPGRKTIVECGALCDSWFNCRSFRSDQDTGACILYQTEQYSKELCTGSEPAGDLFIYWSEFHFVRLAESFCVAANSIIGDILLEVPLEACKTMCDKHELCVSIEHNQAGECALYSSSDFSLPCTKDNERALYIGYKDVLVESGNKYEYKEMQECFDLTNSSDWVNVSLEEECQDLCTGSCLGYQFVQPFQCHVVAGAALPEVQTCGINETVKVMVERYPYQRMNNTCLRNEIYNSTDELHRIYDTEDYECLALCDAHPYCRYFLYGAEANVTNLELRECKLFEAQRQDLNCDEAEEPYGGGYSNLAAFVNGRTFIDQVTWFGEPERTVATLSGLSYQECAAICDALDNQYCSAFIHTWNYRRSSSSGQPQIFTKTRVIYASFSPGDDIALFLQFDEDGQLVMTTSEQNNDDALKSQYISNERKPDNSFLLRFWSKTGKCVASDAFSVLPSGFTREVIYDNFEKTPTCQSLVLEECDSENVITLQEVDYLNATNPGRFALAHDLPHPSNASNPVGCLGVQPTSDSGFWKEMGDQFGGIVIQEERNCSEVNVKKLCTKMTVENTTSWDPFDCNSTFVESKTCTQDEPIPIPWYFQTTQNETSCKFPPTENCTLVSENETRCEYSSEIRTETCWTTQRNAIDLLEEIHQHFELAPECQRPSHSLPTRPILSRSYGPACGYDDQVAIMPMQLFAYASDPVLLSNDATGLCLSAGLSLVPCTDVGTTHWIHIFGENGYGGEIFHEECDDNHCHHMKCLSRASDSGALQVQPCNANSSLNQRWEYDGNNGYLKVPATQICIKTDSQGAIHLGDCNDASSRWSQYSQCQLNTRTKTKPMKVESIESPGTCIGDNAKRRIECSSANEWEYYYDSNKPRLQLLGSSPPMCLAREVENPETNDKELFELPNGLMNCAAENGITPPYYSTILGGENANIFQWVNPLLPEKVYCISIPGQDEPEVNEQQVCSTNLDSEMHWRRHAVTVDATEISVKPELLLSKVTDPEVLFQFFLFTAEGKSSRKLRAQSAGLDRDISRILPVIGSTTNLALESLALVRTVGDKVSSLSDKTNRAEGIFKKLGIAIKPFQYLPYIGPVIRATKLPTIMNQIATRLNDGTKALDRTDKVRRMLDQVCSGDLSNNSPISTRFPKTFSRLFEPFEDFLTAVGQLSTSLANSIHFLRAFVDFVTRTLFCSFQKDLTEYFQRSQEWVRSLLAKVGQAIGLIKVLKNNLAVLDFFKALMNRTFGQFKRFLSLLEGVSRFADSLSFISALADFEICISIPKFCWKRINLGFVKFNIPWICFGNKSCINLEGIGNFMAKIEKIIRSIPLVGHLWTAIEKFVTSILRGLFKFFGIELPEFGIDVGFVDDVQRRAAEAKDGLYALLGQFRNLINIDAFTDWVDDAINSIKSEIPSHLMDFDCDNATCILDKFGIDLPDLDAPFPSISMDGLNFTIADTFVEVIDTILSNIVGFREDFQVLIDGGVECNEYKTISVNIIEYIRNGFDLGEGDLADIPDCPFNFQICTDIHFPEFSAFRENVNNRSGDLGLKEIFSRRRLQSGGTSRGGGVSIPLGMAKDFGKKAASKLIKLMPFAQDKMAKEERNAFCASPVGKLICEPSMTRKPINNAFAEVTIASIFEQFTPNLVVGEEDGEFKLGFSMKGALQGGFVLPRTHWMGISQQAKHTIQTSYLGGIFKRRANYEKFHDQAEMVAKVSKINCLLDFIEATRNARENRLGACNNAEWGFDAGKNREINTVMSFVYEHLNERSKGRKLFAKKLLNMGDTQLDKLLESLEEKLNHDADIRAQMRQHILKEVARLKVSSQKSSNPCYVNDPFLLNAPSEAQIDCSSPNSGSLLDPKEPIRVSERWQSLPKGSQSSISTALHLFYDTHLWRIIKGIQAHPTQYRNLFSTGLEHVGIIRQSLLGNFHIDETELLVPLMGPSWVSGGNWTPPMLDSWRDISPWHLVEFATKYPAQNLPRDDRSGPVKKDLIDAMIDSPVEASHLAFAERLALSVRWSFFRIAIDVSGDNGIDIDLGFDPESLGIGVGT